MFQSRISFLYKNENINTSPAYSKVVYKLNEVTDMKLLCKLQSMVCVDSLIAAFVV